MDLIVRCGTGSARAPMAGAIALNKSRGCVSRETPFAHSRRIRVTYWSARDYDERESCLIVNSVSIRYTEECACLGLGPHLPMANHPNQLSEATRGPAVGEHPVRRPWSAASAQPVFHPAPVLHDSVPRRNCYGAITRSPPHANPQFAHTHALTHLSTSLNFGRLPCSRMPTR